MNFITDIFYSYYRANFGVNISGIAFQGHKCYHSKHMPPPLDVDWEAIKTMAVALGLAETSRRTGVSLDAIQQRSHRESWLRDIPRSEPLPLSIRPTPVVSSVSPAEGMASVMRDLSSKTRLSHAKVAAKVSERLEVADADEILVNMPNVLAAGKHAALVHGWQAGQGGTSVRLDLLAGTLEMTSQTAQECSSCGQQASFDSLEIPE